MHDLLGIDGFPVNLLFQNFSVFADEEVDAARRFVFVDVNTVLASDVSSPIVQRNRHLFNRKQKSRQTETPEER